MVASPRQPQNDTTKKIAPFATIPVLLLDNLDSNVGSALFKSDPFLCLDVRTGLYYISFIVFFDERMW